MVSKVKNEVSYVTERRAVADFHQDANGRTDVIPTRYRRHTDVGNSGNFGVNELGRDLADKVLCQPILPAILRAWVKGDSRRRLANALVEDVLAVSWRVHPKRYNMTGKTGI